MYRERYFTKIRWVSGRNIYLIFFLQNFKQKWAQFYSNYKQKFDYYTDQSHFFIPFYLAWFKLITVPFNHFDFTLQILPFNNQWIPFPTYRFPFFTTSPTSFSFFSCCVPISEFNDWQNPWTIIIVQHRTFAFFSSPQVFASGKSQPAKPLLQPTNCRFQKWIASK